MGIGRRTSWRLALVAIALTLCLPTPQSAHAVDEDGVWGQWTLLGWSKDGKCFAYRYEGNNGKGNAVQCTGDNQPEYDDNGQGLGFDFEKSPALLAFALEPLSASWRRAFSSKFEVKKRQVCKHRSQCDSQFRVVPKSSGKTPAPSEEHLVWGGLYDRDAFVGGYLHPSGKYALLKFHYWNDTHNSDDVRVFILVPLAKP